MIIVIKKRKKEKIVKFFPKIGKNFGPGFQTEGLEKLAYKNNLRNFKAALG